MLKQITIIAFFFFALTACKKSTLTGIAQNNPTDTIPVPPPDTSAPSKFYLALGDSYTIGQNVPVEDRFPLQTVELLKQVGIKFYAPEIIAQTGWTTANLISRLNASSPSRATYDIVTLLIGVNNQYQRLGQAQYINEFSILLNKAIQYADYKPNRVIVLSIPDYSATPFVSTADKAYVSAQIDSFNAINLSLSLAASVHYINITPGTRLAATDLSLLANDRLHPSRIEYAKWADSLQRRIRAIL